jgi:predicted ATPase/DNA-binding CsgD family transcriptional regulator
MQEPTMSGFHPPAHPAATNRLTSEAHAEGTNPAPPLTSFLGREEEQRQVSRLLAQPELRLVTVTGPGGIGKSRLAHEVLRNVRETFADGAVFVPLAPVHDDALVLPTVAQGLGVADTVTQSLAAQVHTFLAERHLLLVLDNAEHLLDAVADLVASLLGACPGLTVLVTSRVRLGLSGEQVVPLATLDPLTARALFVARAQAVAPAFSVTPESTPLLDAVCTRLDHLPLAIELAAARVDVLPLPALLRRLDHRLDVLTGGPRDAPARQRTMRDTIAWSHDLLPEAEQILFRRLGVFAGGFTLEAVQAVAAGQDALAGISALVTASLVNPIPGVGDEPRFTMLETIRDYALEQLAAHGEENATRTLHAAYATALAERTDYCWLVSLPTGQMRLAQLQAEAANLRTALQWLDQQDDRTALLRLASRLGALWVVSGHALEGQRWLERALAGSASAPAPLRAVALCTLSWIMNVRQQDAVALTLAEAGLALCRAHAQIDPLTTELCLGMCGSAAYTVGSHAHAVARLNEGIAIVSAWDAATMPSYPSYPGLRRNLLITMAAQLGMVALLQGDIATAETWYRSALAQQLAGGDAPGESHLYGHAVPAGLGNVARARGDPATALHHYQTCLVLGQQQNNLRAICHGLGGIAGSLAALGDHATAARLFGAGEALHDTFGYDFEREVFDRQRAFGLPEPWARRDDPPRAYADLHRACSGTHRLPPIRDPDEAATRWAAGRRLSLEDAVAEARAVQIAPPAPAREAPFGLTPREREVLGLLAAGHSNRAIADVLSISERTVENHVLHILTKLGLDSRTAAATWAVRHGLA